MLSMNVQLPTYPVTANAELGRKALANKVEFSLNSLLDSNRTVRSHSVAGDITIAHQATREFGGAVRHQIRRNKIANGDLSAAVASLAIVAPKTPAGAIAARQAVIELIGALLTFANASVQYPVTYTLSEDYDEVAVTVSNSTVDIGAQLSASLDRLINGEG